eukprot:261733-Hanusia_phi.AAC.1
MADAQEEEAASTARLEGEEATEVSSPPNKEGVDKGRESEDKEASNEMDESTSPQGEEKEGEAAGMDKEDMEMRGEDPEEDREGNRDQEDNEDNDDKENKMDEDGEENKKAPSDSDEAGDADPEEESGALAMRNKLQKIIEADHVDLPSAYNILDALQNMWDSVSVRDIVIGEHKSLVSEVEV